MTRFDGRNHNQLRPVKITRDFLETAEGSALIECGKTRVICTASISTDKPGWLGNDSRGWITAEYGMLPKSCKTRVPRNKGDGRTAEIQRLVGRAMRAVVNLEKISDYSIWLDCDVLQADGGTRTASVTGACVALVDALKLLYDNGMIKSWPLRELVAATSVGIIGGECLLDLNYAEDSTAAVDMNFVGTQNGNFVEIQGTAERQPFTPLQHETMLGLARQGVAELIAIQQAALGPLPIYGA